VAGAIAIPSQSIAHTAIPNFMSNLSFLMNYLDEVLNFQGDIKGRAVFIPKAHQSIAREGCSHQDIDSQFTRSLLRQAFERLATVKTSQNFLSSWSVRSSQDCSEH
jgi:hypothetical protein